MGVDLHYSRAMMNKYIRLRDSRTMLFVWHHFNIISLAGTTPGQYVNVDEHTRTKTVLMNNNKISHLVSRMYGKPIQHIIYTYKPRNAQSCV